MTPDATPQANGTPARLAPQGRNAAFAARREKLMQQLLATGGGVAVLPTAPEALRNNDSHYAFRHDSNFHYLTGFDEPEAVLVLVATPVKVQSVLFCRPKDAEREIWDGFRLGPEAAPDALQLNAAFPIASIDIELPRLLADQVRLAWPVGQRPEFDLQVQRWIATVRAQSRTGVTAPAQFMDIAPWLEEARLIKDSEEISIMRRAARISAGAHARAMRATRAGLHEYTIEAELHHEFRRMGSQAPAYTSIVAGGANACTLHYSSNDALLMDGDLLLVDAGCELDG
jgi:Xaa-Pro aminopeptidase